MAGLCICEKLNGEMTLPPNHRCYKCQKFGDFPKKNIMAESDGRYIPLKVLASSWSSMQHANQNLSRVNPNTAKILRHDRRVSLSLEMHTCSEQIILICLKRLRHE